MGGWQQNEGDRTSKSWGKSWSHHYCLPFMRLKVMGLGDWKSWVRGTGIMGPIEGLGDHGTQSSESGV